MKDRDAALHKPPPSELSTSRVGPAPGRLGTFAVLGAIAGGVPLPWLPDALERRVRGALAQDVAGRHGLSLSAEARAVFAEPSGAEGPRGVVGQVFKFVSRKILVRFGPLGMLPPMRAGLNTFVLGHLLSRYVEIARTERSVRIDVQEARNVRRLIDRALVHAVTAELNSERERRELPAEDLRDEVTQVVDGVLIAAAGLPSWLVRRLDASFNDVLVQHGHA